MSLSKLEEAQRLVCTANKIGGIVETYRTKTAEARCDKHALKFGGDSRFSVFSVNVFLDCHLGYYGSSNCSTLLKIDNKIASMALDYTLNKNRDLILSDMAAFVGREAKKLISSAKEEVDVATAFLENLEASHG